MTSRGAPALFGWCIDDLHDKCIEWFTNSDRRCACQCHSTRKEIVMDSTQIVEQQYPEIVVPSYIGPVLEPVVEASTSTSSKVDSRAVRAWAKAQGIEVGARGRIKPDVIARYNEAHS